METTSDIILKSKVAADTTSGRQKVIEKLHIKCIYVKIYILTYEKNDRYVKAICIYKNTYDR